MLDDRSRLTRAALALRDSAPLFELATPIADATGASGVTVSTLGPPLGTQVVSATDGATARLAELEVDHGVGPGWEALARRRAVHDPDVQRDGDVTWWVTRDALRAAGVGAVVAFPLVVADLAFGAIELWSSRPEQLSDQQLRDVGTLSAVVARQVLRHALRDAEGPSSDPWQGVHSRREVHQATGMVVAQLRVPPDEALLVLRAHAFAAGRSVRDVSVDVLARRLDFSSPELH